MPNNRIQLFKNGRILRPGRLIKDGIWVRNGKIIPPQKEADEIIDLDNAILAPGYIDLQINGGFEIDFTEEPERVHEVARELPRYGVTSFLPTLISSAPKRYHTSLKVLREAMNSQKAGEATILGIHLEGPFFNPSLARAHNSQYLQSCEKSLEEIYGELGGVKMVTLAPELPGAYDHISSLHRQQIIVSAGHSAATSHQILEAEKAGLGCFTHLFNAMPLFHHRDPGIIGAILCHSTLPFTLIADPHHLHPDAIAIAWKCGDSRLLLVSDAMAGLGARQGRLGEQEITLDSGKATLKGTQTLAGSTQALDSAVRYLWKSTGCSQAAALEAATLRPARLLNLTHKGNLEIDSDADLIILDDDLHVKRCFLRGQPLN